MEIDPAEMIALCIALLDHLAALAEPVPGLDDAAVAPALSRLTEGMAALGVEADAAGASIEAVRPMVGEMSAEDLQEGAAFCTEMAEGL